MKATTTIPIVVVGGSDAVAEGTFEQGLRLHGLRHALLPVLSSEQPIDPRLLKGRLAFSLATTTVAAQQHEHPVALDKLGTVAFPNSCSAAAVTSAEMS